jgi:hypothetical protein
MGRESIALYPPMVGWSVDAVRFVFPKKSFGRCNNLMYSLIRVFVTITVVGEHKEKLRRPSSQRHLEGLRLLLNEMTGFIETRQEGVDVPDPLV